MTFLELCQMTTQQTGTIQSGTTIQPITVVGQIDRLKQIVDFVREAYVDIQNAHRMWRWLQSRFVGQTITGQRFYLGTAFNDEQTNTPVTRFSQWGVRHSGDDAGLSMYATSIGPADEGRLRFLDIDRFYETQARGVQTPDKPQYYTIDNLNRLVVSPPPNGTFTLRGKYRKSVQYLTNDGDVPEMPSDFHTLIKDAALAYIEGFDEGPRIPLYRLRMLPNFSMLEAQQLPKVTWGAPLA
jgi:hypothetical protein